MSDWRDYLTERESWEIIRIRADMTDEQVATLDVVQDALWARDVAAGRVAIRCKVCEVGLRIVDPNNDPGCSHCVRLDGLMFIEQTRMDRERMQELVGRVENDDPAAIAPLVALWRAAGERLGTAARWRIARALGTRRDDGAA